MIVLNGQPVICGGLGDIDPDFYDNCLGFNGTDWIQFGRLSERKDIAGAVALGPDAMMVTGI